MFRTFNMGIGMILVVPAVSADKIRPRYRKAESKIILIGEVAESSTEKIKFV